MTTQTTQTTQTTPQLPDLRPLLLRAFEVADTLVAEVGPDDLDRPTPCEEFDVRGLLDHLVMVARRVRVVLGGGHFAEVPQVTGLADDELGPAWTAALAELSGALPSVGLADLVTAPFGTVPAGAAVASYTGEVGVHAWDLAAALGRTDLLDASVVEPLLGPTRQRLPRDGREHLPFGEVVDVPDDAPAYDRLVGWMGRDPHWRA